MKRPGRAIRAFEAFKGEKPTSMRRARLADADVTGWEMGELVGIAYSARRDGETERYFHEFKRAARPRLVSSDDGRQLYIDGGRYKVGSRGIEDMPNLFVVNPDPRPGLKSGGSTMANRRARRASASRRRRRSSSVSIFTTNPRRRRRSSARRRIFATNPRRRRRRSYRRNLAAPRRIYRRNPARRRARASGRRRYRRNPSGLGIRKLSDVLMPAIFIGLGAVGVDVALAYLPLPLAWKTGPMKAIVKGAVGVAIGITIAKVFKQRRLGYYFAAGAVVVMTYDLAKGWLAKNVPAVRMGQYGRQLPSQFGQYGRQLPLNRFGYTNTAAVARFNGMNSIPNAHQPGGEMPWAA